MSRIEKIRKTLVVHLALCTVPFVFISFLWTGCSEEQLFPGNARIKTAFRLTTQSALGGSLTIQQAYLKLEGITVTGTRGDKNLPEANYTIPSEDPPYRLSQGDTARVSLTLPSGAYDQMDLHLFLLQTDYNLIVHHKTSEQTPPPVTGGNDDSPGGGTDPTNGNDSDDGQHDDDAGQPDGNNDQPNEGGDEGGDDDDDDEADRDDHESDRDGDDHNGDDDEKDKGGKEDKDGKKKGKKDKEKDDDEKKDDGDDDDRGDDDRIGGIEVDGTVDLDHFFQHAKPSLVVFATWTFNGQTVNVVFAVTDVERITIRATQNDSQQIRVDEHGQGIVNFDPERWFQSISTTDLENASLQTYQDQTVMFIHKDVNKTLFATLMNNLTSSTTFEVAASSDR